MKVEWLRLKYFKRFADFEINFCDEAGYPKDVIVLIGDNGSGKTSLLQALTLVVGTAANVPFDWPGFDEHLAHANWRIPPNVPSIECRVRFAEAELAATREYFDLTDMAGKPQFIAPGQSSTVTLRYYPGRGKVEADSPAEFFQFRGYDYAKQALKRHPAGSNIFGRVGSIRWYSQHRIATSLTPSNGDNSGLNLDVLRQRLSEWENFHLRMGREGGPRSPQRDLYGDLKETYRRLFPDHDFVGSVPREGDDVLQTSYFMLSRGNQQYEISEMSAGEQAIFPILFDFVKWETHHSIILIDEVELHLHPPLQQALVRGLPRLGTHNQFILTTHSESVLNALPDSSVYRIGA